MQRQVGDHFQIPVQVPGLPVEHGYLRLAQLAHALPGDFGVLSHTQPEQAVAGRLDKILPALAAGSRPGQTELSADRIGLPAVEGAGQPLQRLSVLPDAGFAGRVP